MRDGVRDLFVCSLPGLLLSLAVCEEVDVVHPDLEVAHLGGRGVRGSLGDVVVGRGGVKGERLVTIDGGAQHVVDRELVVPAQIDVRGVKHDKLVHRGEQRADGDLVIERAVRLKAAAALLDARARWLRALRLEHPERHGPVSPLTVHGKVVGHVYVPATLGRLVNALGVLVGREPVVDVARGVRKGNGREAAANL